MKLLHTADWHLGKTLKGQNLLDDQIFILNQLFDVISDQNPDAIIISGDIYDRGIPPAEAVELFDDILNRFAEKKLPTLIISGNHDSATRLNFGSKLFRSKNIFITSKIEDIPAQVVLEDNFGEIYFSLIPFFDPAEIKAKFFDENAERLTFNDANKFYIDLARKNIPENKRSVAIAHVFLTGGVESESERKFVGGSANVNAQIFNKYNYVALGHLHRPQKISSESIRYAGSPLKYSFDEANHKKSVAIVEIDNLGAINVEKIDLKPRRDVKIVKGNIYQLMQSEKTEDYICARLTERVINVQDKLRYVFPHLLSVEFDFPKNDSKIDDEAKIFREGVSILDYFSDFYQAQTHESLNSEYRAEMGKFLSEIEKEE